MPTGTFTGASTLDDDALTLALGPALTPNGIVASPTFFRGFATHPQVLARGLLVLADITATRYFRHTPTSLRDPVLTAHGDRLRVECFSACNGVHARLDLLADGFDGGALAHGTTNVDIGPAMRSALGSVHRHALLHLAVGIDGMTVSDPHRTDTERPVAMPDRWVRALGNVAEMHRELHCAFTVDAAGTRRFLATVPPATGAERSGWLTPSTSGVRLAARPTRGAVHIDGLHRLTAAKRLLPHVQGMTVYGPDGSEPGPLAVEFALPSARLVLGLTEQTWRGHSGEGALLQALTSPTVRDDAETISALLAFEPSVDIDRLARETTLDRTAVHGALAVLASSGRIGWDLHESTYFHRELPDDPDRVDTDNPRLVAARGLVEAGAITATDPDTWSVRGHGSGGTTEHRVTVGHGAAETGRCTCTWYLRHADRRGPCRHILAVRLHRKGIA
ncbi:MULTISPECIES: SWIM zinc finger family protein [unclassified Rhodococcus (in: high G+C Gram-positive bacteria)]|uniref:SWIM zinc finger family protein n=1 Tax=Rhodococcus sp. SJ-3 TaxID=3454628 RepID=UPI003F797908